jgi:multimeric flavodoxin WrbA
VHVIVVYHSGHGHTARQAAAVAAGASGTEGVVATLFNVDESEPPWAQLLEADAIVFGTPTYMGGPSARFKSFQEATSKRVFADGLKWRDKIAAGFTNSASRSGDKLATLMQLALFAAQHGMHWVSLGMLPGNHSSQGSEEDLNRLGFFLGAAAQSNSDEPAETAPPHADLLTAQHLGRRVAGLAVQLALGRAAGLAIVEHQRGSSARLRS